MNATRFYKEDKHVTTGLVTQMLKNQLSPASK